MKIVKGDLIDLALQGKFDIIIHGCNCFCTMGAGIAKQIKEKFPEAYEADKRTISGDKSKLGKFSFSLVVRDDVSFFVVNAYTQYDYGNNKTNVDYVAIRSCFKNIRTSFYLPELKIAYPKIGCGLAGGDWEKVRKIIEEELKGYNHTYVEYCEEEPNEQY